MSVPILSAAKFVCHTAGKRPKDSNRLRQAQAKVSRLHAQIRNARTDWLHKQSTRIASENALVVLEDLNIRAMSASATGTKERPGRCVRQKAGLNRSILDQGWGEFGRQLAYKLQWRGGLLVKIPPAYTSQRCAQCGHVAAENRYKLRFACVACGHTDHADVNAAKNILAAGHAVLAGVSPGHADVEDAEVKASCEASTPSQALA
jgi:putative transposase